MREASQKPKSNPGCAGIALTSPPGSPGLIGGTRFHECPVVVSLQFWFSFSVPSCFQTYPAKICGWVIPCQPANLILLLLVEARLASACYSFIEANLSLVRFDLFDSLLDTALGCAQAVKLEDLQHGRRFVGNEVLIRQPLKLNSLLPFRQVPRGDELEVPRDHILNEQIDLRVFIQRRPIGAEIRGLKRAAFIKIKQAHDRIENVAH